ncbi:LamG-like jellyroll fold domain-containing protein [Pirellulimonas nuda]
MAGAVLAHEGHEHADHDAASHDAASHEHDAAAPQAMITTREGARVLPPAKEDGVFHFVVYGDRTGGVPAGLKVLRQAVVDSNLLDPDLVMTVGDLIQGYNDTPEWMRQMREFKGIMNGLRMKWFPVAGNHDVYWRGEGPAPQGQHDSDYEKHFGPLWYAFQHKNAGFIVLYSDEGDPVSNEKDFGQPRLQQMSEEQLAFLDKALAELKGADHVFVFLHHPRWTGGNYGDNWRVVHDKLTAAGNVSAVFAGHIHHMRYDGPKLGDGTDGIAYYTLATTGGHLSADIPGAGYLHHLNLVTVRKDRISVSALPVGAVMDPREFTPEFLKGIELARTIRPVRTGPELVLESDGSAAGSVMLRVKNPSPREVLCTASLDAPSPWRSTLDHQHFALAAGGQKDLDFRVLRAADGPGEMMDASLPGVRLELEYLGESARVRLPDVVAPLGLQPGQVPADYFKHDEGRGLAVDGEASAVLVPSAEVRLPDGPMTLEAWLKPNELSNFRGVIAKTQGSEFAIFSDEGAPKFDIHLNGKYVSAVSNQKLSTKKWSHVAGVFDGKQVAIYVDGKLIDSKPASGSRKTNKLPLVIGADPDGSGQPSRPFSGMVDEVRLSSKAVYDGEFAPQRRLAPEESTVLLLHLDKRVGPFTLDHSASAAKGLMGAASQLVPVGK